MGFRWSIGKPRPSVPEVLRCSFCNKAEPDVRKLIAGPTVFICDECVAVCNDILSDVATRFESQAIEPPPSSASKVSGRTLACTLCGMTTFWEESIVVPERGALCPGCVGAVEVAIAQAREITE
jgi:hypothetical protein